MIAEVFAADTASGFAGGMGDEANWTKKNLRFFWTLRHGGKIPRLPAIKDANLLEMGYRDCLAANLTVRGKSIGMFCINALAKDFFSKDVIPLFRRSRITFHRCRQHFGERGDFGTDARKINFALDQRGHRLGEKRRRAAAPHS
jgi:hypothetical protein